MDTALVQILFSTVQITLYDVARILPRPGSLWPLAQVSRNFLDRNMHFAVETVSSGYNKKGQHLCICSSVNHVDLLQELEPPNQLLVWTVDTSALAQD